tara:strand:+ start:4643 stop:5080 length:438 start_codon:yes stop_codon:yes gene_type:complete
MNTQDGIALTGKLIISLNDEIVQETNNLIVTAGKEWVTARMKNTSTVMTHMGVGTSSTAAALTDTALVAEHSDGRQTLTASGGTVAGAIITFHRTFAAGNQTGAITEAGIFTASTSGTMLARTVFGVVNKGALDTMTISWAVTIS